MNWYQRFKRSDAHTQANIFCTIIIAVATVAYAVIALKTLTQTENATREATQTQIILNLPLIVPIKPRIEWNNTITTGGVFVRDDFENIGETRAVAPLIDMGWGYELPSNKTQYQVSDTNLAKWTWTKGVVRTEASKGVPLDEVEEWERVVSAKKPLYFYVRIRYNDLFPPDKEAGHRRNDHLVESCIQINHIEDGAKTNGVTTFWYGIPCAGRSDCIDKECGADYAQPK